MRSRLLAWAWIWVGVTALGAFFGTTLWLNYIAQGREAHFTASLVISLAEWWIWALLAPLPIWLAGRFPLSRPHVARDASVHLVAGFAAAALKALLERIVRIWLFGVAPYLLPSTVALHFLIYWAIVLLAIGAAYYRRSRARELQAAQLEARLSESRLELLRAQLQPHFLFNSLNTIAELIHEDPDRADRMLTGLSDLLRASLDAGGRQEVPLRDELDLTRRYLDIHAARFGDRLRVDIEVPEACLDARVPHFVLQPLVENAVVHGIAPSADPGLIRIAATASESQLELVVEDSGQGIDGAAPAAGIGLANTRARLEALYRGRASLVVAPRAGGGTRAVIVLPLERRR